MVFEKLSRDKPENTKIMAGATTFTIEQLQSEMDMNTEIGRKLKTVEKILEEKY